MNLGTSIKGKKHLWKNVKEEKSPIKIRQFKFLENVLLLLFICCISLPLENAVKKYGAFMIVAANYFRRAKILSSKGRLANYW